MLKLIKTKILRFNIEKEHDKDLFERLMNEPQFKIIYYKDNFSTTGAHSIVAIYQEDLDYKKPKDDQEA